jgi:hypothetical protein
MDDPANIRISQDADLVGPVPASSIPPNPQPRHRRAAGRGPLVTARPATLHREDHSTARTRFGKVIAAHATSPSALRPAEPARCSRVPEHLATSDTAVATTGTWFEIPKPE